MEPEENQSTPQNYTPAVVVEEPPPPPADAHLEGVVALIGSAVLFSLFLRSVGRSTAATKIRRWMPLLYAIVWGFALSVVTWLYVRDLSETWVLAIWLLFLGAVIVSVGWLRSVAAGVALSIEGRFGIGDSIRVGDVEGEVVMFGMRAVRLRSFDGTLHSIPNDKFMTESIANLTGGGGGSACEIRVPLPRAVVPEDALSIAREIAVVTPYASPRHRPEVFLLPRRDDARRLDIAVRGYAFDAAFQDHFRSDVISRLNAALGVTESQAEPEDQLLLRG